MLVIGGGNTASDAARSAIRLGGGAATIVSLESEDELLIVPEDLEQARDEGVAFAPNTSLVRVLAENGHVTGAVLCEARLAKDDSGAVRPELVPGTEREVACDTIFIAIGQVQQLEWLPEHLSDRGHDHRRRARPGRGQHLRRRRRDARPVDGGGRARRRQAGRPRHRPAADRAGTRPPTRPVEVMPYAGLNSAYFRHAPRIEAPLSPAAERRRSQKVEVTLAYSQEQAVAEADRCMSCGVCNGCDNCYIVCPDVSVLRDARENGHYSIRTTYCKGCLVCVQECPTGCLEKVPEMDFDDPADVTRMETAFAPYDGAHAEQSAFTKQLIEETIAEYDAARRQAAPSNGRQRQPHPSQRRSRGEPMTTVHVEGAWAEQPAYGPGLRTPDGEQLLAELAGTRKRLNGCAAAAYAALYANVDVITAYPIRPYTAIMMNLAQFIADGILDAEYITRTASTPSCRRRSAPGRAGRGPSPAPPGSA